MGLRFADILTTAASVASYLGEPEVTARHLLASIDILEGRSSMADLGRGVSPLVRRPAGSGAVAPEVRALVQRWFERLGGDVAAELDEATVAEFRRELLE